MRPVSRRRRQDPSLERSLIADSGKPDRQEHTRAEHAVGDLPSDTLVYLLASRYCETDLLMDTAWKLFGNVRPGWSRVQAICDFVTHPQRVRLPATHAQRQARGGGRVRERRASAATSPIWR